MSGRPLQEMVHRIGEIQPRLPAGTSLGIGLAALAAVGFPGTWMFIRYFTTMAHEGSHVVMRSLLGFKITGVDLNMKDADGETRRLIHKLLVFLFWDTHSRCSQARPSSTFPQIACEFPRSGVSRCIRTVPAMESRVAKTPGFPWRNRCGTRLSQG